MKKILLKTFSIFIIVFLSFYTFLSLIDTNEVNASEETTPNIEIYKNNVSYSSEIYIMYAVAYEGFEINKYEVKMLFWNTHQDSYLKGTEDVVKTNKGKQNIDDKECLVFPSEGLAAKHMTDDLYARAYVNIDGVEYYSEVVKFSVLEYAYKMRNSNTLNPHQQRLIETLLSYGGAAQNNFGYNTDRLADSDYYAINLKNGHHHDGFEHGLYQKGEKIKIKAHHAPHGKKFSHWIDKDGNIVGDKEEIEIEVGKDNDFEAIYKDITTIILKDNLSIDEPYDATAATLNLPDYVTVNNAENIEEQIEVSWDTTTFVENQVGEQIIYGNLLNTDYVLETPLSIKVNIFPYTFIYNESIDQYAINKYYGTSEKEIIPTLYREKNIYKINQYAFNEVLTLEELYIPETIEIIDQGAIYLCDNITKITIPFIGVKNSMSKEYIGYMFGASSYSENLTYIPTNLKEITILEGMDNIEKYTFNGCSNLTTINLPNSVTYIGEEVFYECSSLTSIKLSKNITGIGWGAFGYCSSLDSVYYEGTIENWCNINFYSYHANPMAYATHLYMKNESDEWEEVTSVVIPESITEVKKYQFYGIENLTTVTLPSELVSINESSFDSCINLTEITIPSKVSIIGDDAFYKCSSLNNVNIESNRLVQIGSYAFAYCSNLTLFTIPNTVTNIGTSAFGHCENLTTVNFEENSQLTTIGGYAFSNCINLQQIEIPNTVTTIGSYAFGYCEKLTTVSLPNTLSTIESYTFIKCKSLVNISIPNNVQIIGHSAFDGCYSLTNIEIPSSVTTIGNYAFSDCQYLINATFNDDSNLVSIGDYAFYSCMRLESITLSNSLTSIGTRAFHYCQALTDVYYNGTIENWCNITFKIDDSNPMYDAEHFYMKNELSQWEEVTEIIIPNTITEIGKYQFCGFDNLLSTTLPNTITTINDSAFNRCSNLTSIYLPSSIETIESNAFLYCSRLVIYCESDTSKEGWSSSWNYSNCTVYYGINETNFVEINGLQYVLDLENKTATFTKYVGTSDSIEIPTSITYNEVEYTVTSIGNRAVNSNYILRTVIIPNTITNIGEYAFYNCNTLESVYIPNSVRYIGAYAFAYCDNATIYCESGINSSNWDTNWNSSNRPVVW